jgi:FkbM family methyltransferase
MNFNTQAKNFISARRIDLALDVGANAGQFARLLRNEYCYEGKVISFEPLTEAYAKLADASAGDHNWSCVNMALGDTETTSAINVSENSWSSSILEVAPRSVEVEPSISYVGRQEVIVRRLDNVFQEMALESRSIFLKMDVQGYEMQVLLGSLKILDRVKLIQIETSLVPVYKGEPLVGDMIKMLDLLGFRIVAVEPGWHDPKTNELLQMDLMLARK